MELKPYQQNTLDALENFLHDAKLIGCAAAFNKHRNAPSYPRAYSPLPNLEDAPYICLRLPTGGGKTLLGACAICAATEKFFACEYPLVLWLVPSDVIRQQTLKLLRDPKTFYRQELDAAFKGQVNIFDVTEFRQLRPQDLEQSLNIFVATFQSFRVTNRDGRKVYQSNEALEACFRDIPRHDYFEDDAAAQDYKSFGNLIAYLRPLMIVDEAHNNSSPLSLDVMQKLRPAAVIELTATPKENVANVLYQVSAEELKADSMIKMPIILRESLSWEAAIDEAIQQRNKLEHLANRESKYIRPIALFQAENQNRDANVDAVKRYLIDGAKVPANQITVATGELRELDGVNLSARDCPIRYVVTVQALKEGWDCPFAYVFCSLARVNSAMAAEQFLGRVLRMPYVTRRESPALNKAYAFAVVDNWHDAATKLRDNLLGMGFEKPEAALAIQQMSLDLTTTIRIATTGKPQTNGLNLGLQGSVAVEKTATGYELVLTDITEADISRLSTLADKVFTNDADREKFRDALYNEDFEPARDDSPSAHGVKFAMPLLCLDFGDRIEVAEKETFLPTNWRLTGNYDTDLPNFRRDIEAQVYEFDINDHKVTEKYLGDDTTNLFRGETNWTQADLIGRFADRIIATDLDYEDLAEFIRRILNRLSEEENIALDELVRLRFSLLKVLTEKIDDCRAEALKHGWQETLFGDDGKACVRPNITKIFDAEKYPAKSFYNGNVQFEKHYYKLIGGMDSDEELRCAQLIDANKNVATWIRNVAGEPRYSFWLPTHKGKFYPDFVVKLTDGSYAAIEYKGAHLADGADTEEKKLVGELWQRKRGGKFLLATWRDDKGRDLAAQIKEFLR